MNLNEFSYANESNFTNEEFIEIQYQLLFGRSPDFGGFQHYLGKLNTGSPRQKIVLDLVNSSEFRGDINSIIDLRSYLDIYNDEILKNKKVYGLKSKKTQLKKLIKAIESSDLNNKKIKELKQSFNIKNDVSSVLDISLRDIVSIPSAATSKINLLKKVKSLNFKNFDGKNTMIETESQSLSKNNKMQSVTSLLNNALIKLELWDILLSYSSGKKNIWFGLTSPIKVDFYDYGRYTNFRAPSYLHANYDVVWLYEANIFSNSYWKLLLDESIHLLKENGHLIIRAVDNLEGTIWELKSILGRSVTLKCELLHQFKLDDGSVVLIFSIIRKNMSFYQSKNWTIGILTNGTKNQNVINLINEFEKIKDSKNIEYIIAGPYIEELTQFKNLNITYFDTEYADNLPRISLKKHQIMNMAKFENIAIFHDRYTISSDFFTGFDIFGYDFDFVTVSQTYENGQFFPGYAGLKEHKKRWQQPFFDINNNTLFDGHFINGGLMIMKKHLASTVNFNPLLLHNEAEDVELTYQMIDSGIMPRYNKFSNAITIGTSTAHTATFQQI